MDAPLLAPSGRLAADDGAAIANMRQLIALRWIAAGGQLATILAVHYGLGVALRLAPMLGVILLLAVANLAGYVLLAYGRVNNPALMFALLIDIAALTVQLYLSGGAANPFISLYLLQVVLGAILLETWSVWVLVAVTAFCFAGLTVGGVPLVFPPALRAESQRLYTFGALASFALTCTLLGMFITRITRNLRARDRYLADLDQRTAERDGIVRMGLFASGAAHELGTPLATLSVILGDWRRMPKLAGDPELAGELAEMQAEVERCKAIVTDILHSAGEPRSEAIESAPAGAFLDAAVAAWRPLHAGIPLHYGRDDFAGAALVTGASLRQAIWNLLDNAAEASPGGVALHARREGGELVVVVADEGPGFAEAQLAAIGRPYQSRKGAGHGLGLFLAVNVARQLGGRLEARNRAEGGAEVRLILPLAARQGGAA